MGALTKVLVAVMEKLAVKLLAAGALLLAVLDSALSKRSEDAAEMLARLVAARLLESDAARAALVGWITVLLQALAIYGWLVAGLFALGLVLVGAGHVPLLWRSLTARRPAVFVSYQNQRNDQARAVAGALGRERFRVLRVDYQPQAAHQQIVMSVNDMLRRSDAMVCLPGSDASFVEAEVAAATVAGKPVVFVLAEAATLPNTADKRHPVFSQERSARRGYAPVADFLHHVTCDYRSTRMLYRRAWAHPWVGLRFAQVMMAAAIASLLLFAASVLHGHLVTAAPAGSLPPDLAQARWLGILLVTVPLLLGALVALPAAGWFLLVARALAVQLRAARRAALRAQAGEFARADWKGLVPGMRPGEDLYEAMLERAPEAHHERRAAMPL